MPTDALQTNLRKFISSMLLGLVGFAVGGITAGVVTLYVYGIGWLIGAPIGFVVGGVIGWRKPLRDTVILFLSYMTLLMVVVQEVKLNSALTGESFFVQLLWVFLGGPVAYFLATLPSRMLSFDNRKKLAVMLIVVWGIGLATYFYCWIYVWEPS